MFLRYGASSPRDTRFIPGTEIDWEPRLAPWPAQSGVPNWALHNPYYMCSLRRFQYLDRVIGPGYKPPTVLPSEVVEYPALVMPEPLSDERDPRVSCRHTTKPRDVLYLLREMRIVAQALSARLLEYELEFGEQISQHAPEQACPCLCGKLGVDAQIQQGPPCFLREDPVFLRRWQRLMKDLRPGLWANNPGSGELNPGLIRGFGGKLLLSASLEQGQQLPTGCTCAVLSKGASSEEESAKASSSALMPMVSALSAKGVRFSPTARGVEVVLDNVSCVESNPCKHDVTGSGPGGKRLTVSKSCPTDMVFCGCSNCSAFKDFPLSLVG